MRAYVETFKSRRGLFLLAVVIAAAIGGWFTFGAAKTYRSTAMIWVDNGPVAGSSLSSELATQTAGDPPSLILQSELKQLLDSVTFDQSVGDRSLLRAYLIANPKPIGFSPSVLLSRGSGSVGSEIVASISKQVKTSEIGPQLLSLSYVGPTPAVSRSVLSALLSRLSRSTEQLGEEYQTAEERYYARELSYRQTDATSLEQAAAEYQRQHPGVTAGSDPIYAGLLSAARSGQATLTVPTAALDRLAAQPAAGAAPLSDLVQQPTLPGAPVKGIAADAVGLLAGGFAGLIIAALATSVMTPPPEGRWDEENPASHRRFAGDPFDSRPSELT